MAEDEVKDKAPSSEKKAPSQEKVALRKAAGVASMLVGLPNLIVSVIAIIASIVGIIFAAIMLVALIFKDTGDDACAGLIVALLIMVFLALLIVAVIVLVFAMILSLAVSGQTVGGIMAIRGRRFGASVILMIIGSIVSSFFGMVLTIGGLLLEDIDTSLRIVITVFGLYDLFASFITGASAIAVMTMRSTFKRPEKKKKSSKKEGK